jgi:carbon-monoxide dehydrogenase small subunit
MGSTHDISVEVNGRLRRATVPARTSFADFLRDRLGLTGTHLGCEHGVCGACTVLLDGTPVRSCIVLAAQADGDAVTTVEGLAGSGGELNPVQAAFCRTHALQCGFCTPGMVLAVQALVDEVEEPTREEIDDAIGGNICRCTGYMQIREAVRSVVDEIRTTRELAAAGTTKADAP